MGTRRPLASQDIQLTPRLYMHRFDPVTGGSDRAVRTQAVFGLTVVVALMYAFSKDRKNIKWQTVIVGLSLQQVSRIPSPAFSLSLSD